MDRKAVARETLHILKQGYYDAPVKAKGGTKAEEQEKKRVSIADDMKWSVSHSILITPQESSRLLETYEAEVEAAFGEKPGEAGAMADKKADRQSQTVDMGSRVENISTVDAIRMLFAEGKVKIGVLNFASAKNPGGGFLNGAMAQEESLAASSALYETLTANEEYYRVNRANRSMMYTDYGIYSPNVTFFRDGRFCLTQEPVKASVLTMPAVNMGQVLLKGEDMEEAKRVMRRRMKLTLAIFANQGAKDLVLGAYGCGVFRNDPLQVAVWWKEILEEGFDRYFESVIYAVLDRSRDQTCIRAFQKVFLGEGE
ncbi:MAG: TIGR02452 family protein [Hungatella sp.]|jgi:uncharacterized protein (TIGR02452 family)|nr:TIGR02452 family protein [Hungatella sp.]